MTRVRHGSVERVAVWSTMITLGLLLVARVAAQPEPHAPVETPPSPSDVEAARAAFREGTEAVHANRWEPARVAFARAYELAPNALVLMNLAAAEMHTGHLAAAARHYRSFMREASQGVAQSYRDAAAQALGGLEPRVPVARLSLAGLESGDRLRLDAEPVARMSATSEIQVDPGEHTLVVIRDDHEIASTTFTAEESHTVEVALHVAPSARHAAEVGAHGARPSERGAMTLAPSERDDGGFLGSPGFWLTMTGVVVVAAVTVGVVLAVSGSTAGPTFDGNLGRIPVQ